MHQIDSPTQLHTDRDLREARVAHVLARAVRDGEVAAQDALRILRHQLRLRNTNKALMHPTRSHEAARVIAEYAPGPVPKNGSPDALHSDHVYPLTEEVLRTTLTVEAWLSELARLSAVVCVTAAENYALQQIERGGLTGPAKYAHAGIEMTTRQGTQ